MELEVLKQSLSSLISILMKLKMKDILTFFENFSLNLKRI